MGISVSEIQHLASLACIDLSQEEVVEIQVHLERVLSHFESLSQFDTSNIDPSQRNGVGYAQLREDVVTDSFPQEKALSNAPAISHGFFSVTKVISHSGGSGSGG